MQNLEIGRLRSRQGFDKLKNTCARAAADGFDYVWIDICCIDKRSSAELSEAINSRYRWYQNAIVCYAYLDDVCSDPVKDPERMVSEFRRSRWFTRGWTLQELIAPSVLIFFNQTWQELGTKTSMAATISSFTYIPQSVLLGGALDQESVATRMSWASTRRTTRVEDLAYCLLGIFNINMPLLYGEGERAFITLQEEIIKVCIDYSLFAWTSYSRTARGLLASAPSAFAKSAGIVPVPGPTSSGDAATVDSEGVHVRLRVKREKEGSGTYLALFPCTKGTTVVGIYLKGEVGACFERGDYANLLFVGQPRLAQFDIVESKICIQQQRVRHHKTCPLQEAAAYGNLAVVNMLLEKGVDPDCYNITTGETPLTSAAGKGYAIIVRTLLEHDAKVVRKTQLGRLPLAIAIRNGHYGTVLILLNHLTPLCGDDDLRELRSSVMFALHRAHRQVLEVFAEYGGDVARAVLCEPTALEYAIEGGSGDVVEFLLTFASKFHQTTDQIPMLESLQTGGLDILDGLDRGRQSFHDILNVLLKYCPDLPHQRIFRGYKPLDRAVTNNDEDAVKLLLQQDAGLDKVELLPISIKLAAARGYDCVLRALMAESEHLKERIVHSDMLRAAIDNGREGVVKLLLEEGLDPAYVDPFGETPLLWAERQGHEGIVDLLLAHGAAPHMGKATGLRNGGLDRQTSGRNG